MSWNSMGVPSVPNLPKNVGDAVIKFGGALAINLFFGNYWGIFDQNGLPLLLADNVKSVKFQNRSKISTSPIEQGSFTAYNKVIEPYTVNVMMTKGTGGVKERGAFLALIDGFANSTDLFMVITPEAIYPNCNIIGYDYSREAADGARLLKVNLQLQEIREVKVEYTKTKAESASVEQNNGNVQAKEIEGGKSQEGKNSTLLDLAKSVKEKGFLGAMEEGFSKVGDMFSNGMDQMTSKIMGGQ